MRARRRLEHEAFVCKRSLLRAPPLPLRWQELYQELKGHLKENDETVPVPRGAFSYFTKVPLLVASSCKVSLFFVVSWVARHVHSHARTRTCRRSRAWHTSSTSGAPRTAAAATKLSSTKTKFPSRRRPADPFAPLARSASRPPIGRPRLFSALDLARRAGCRVYSGCRLGLGRAVGWGGGFAPIS